MPTTISLIRPVVSTTKVVLWVIFLVPCWSVPPAKSWSRSPGGGGFWQITDVHVDLEKECSGTATTKYGNFNGQYGCGCTVETVNATAAFMGKTTPHPDFVLFTGDATASGDIMANLHVIQDALAANFANIPIYLVLGNHDFPGSPVGAAAEAWYKNVSEAWGSPWLDKDALSEFSQFGYYSTSPPMATSPSPSTPIRIIALNTELFNHGNSHVVAGETIEEALAHLNWLNTTLAATAAAGQRAYIIGHIPLGIETAYGNDRRVPSSLRPYWMDLYARRYQDIIDSFGEEIVAIQIFGHEHVDTFRLLGEKTVELSVPSLSTAYPRTNPTVRYWHHTLSPSDGGNGNGNEGSVHVVDYDQYYLDLLESNARLTPLFHHSYSFQSEYGLPNLTRASFEVLLSRFSLEQHVGQEGWGCRDQTTAAIYVPDRSVSHKDAGFNATKQGCAEECSSRPDVCNFFMWGHSTPDYHNKSFAWCYLLRECGVEKDTSSDEYEPKYAVFSSREQNRNRNGTSYARERRFFLSSTPTSIQPECDEWCMMQDLCDKSRSGSVTTDSCFTQCVEDNGRRLVNVNSSIVRVNVDDVLL